MHSSAKVAKLFSSLSFPSAFFCKASDFYVLFLICVTPSTVSIFDSGKNAVTLAHDIHTFSPWTEASRNRVRFICEQSLSEARSSSKVRSLRKTDS